MRLLANIDAASLEGTPIHLSVESEVAEARVSGKLTIFIHHKMLHIVTNGDCMRSWSNEVSSTSWKQCWKGTGDVTLSVELIDGSSTSGRP